MLTRSGHIDFETRARAVDSIQMEGSKKWPVVTLSLGKLANLNWLFIHWFYSLNIKKKKKKEKKRKNSVKLKPSML